MAAMVDILAEMEKATPSHRKQRLYSVWVVTCPCGVEFESREKETKCPVCGRQAKIEWGTSALRRPS